MYLKNKAKDLDAYARASAKHWASKWKRSKTGSAAAGDIILLAAMRLPQTFFRPGL